MATGADWVTRLLPECIDERLRQPADALLVYQQVTWHDDTESATPTLDAGVAWEGPAPRGGVERRLWSRARVGSATLAESLLVVRHGGNLGGEPATTASPPHPAPPTVEVDAPVVVSEDDVHAFVASVDGHYPATIAMPEARARGFSGILVPGALLLLAALGRQLHAPKGEVEAWFLGPVPAGALLTRRRDAVAGLESLHLAGRQRPSVVLRWRVAASE